MIPDNDDLIRRFMEGDPAAFAKIRDCLKFSVEKHVLECVIGLPDSEDIVQEAFLRLFAERSSIRGNNGLNTIRAWLCTTAVRIGLDSVRAGGRRRSTEEVAALLHAARHLEAHKREEMAIEVNEATKDLTDGQRAAIALRFQGSGLAEIGRTLNVSTSQAHRLCETALQALHRYFQENCYDEICDNAILKSSASEVPQ